MTVATNKSLESGSYHTNNYMDIFMCVYIWMCVHTYSKTSMSAFGSWHEEEKKTYTFILKWWTGKDSQKFWRNIWLLLLTGKVIEWIHLYCPISFWQHHCSYRDLKPTAWIVFEIWTQALHDSCAHLWTNRKEQYPIWERFFCEANH